MGTPTSLACAAVVLCLLGAPAAGAPTGALPRSTLYAVGGTPVTNGLFFPGTTFYNSERREFEIVGPPLRVAKGTNVEFVNLDPAPLTNSHRIRSFDHRKNGRPLFQTKDVAGPGITRIKTKHLNPGTYFYLCTIHSGMFGAIEVTRAP